MSNEERAQLHAHVWDLNHAISDNEYYAEWFQRSGRLDLAAQCAAVLPVLTAERDRLRGRLRSEP